MSAKEDYELAKAILEPLEHAIVPTESCDRVLTQVTDRIRQELTGARIHERSEASKMLNHWADTLESDDDSYVAEWLRNAASHIRSGDFAAPIRGLSDDDFESDTGPLIADEEEDL